MVGIKAVGCWFEFGRCVCMGPISLTNGQLAGFFGSGCRDSSLLNDQHLTFFLTEIKISNQAPTSMALASPRVVVLVVVRTGVCAFVLL